MPVDKRLRGSAPTLVIGRVLEALLACIVVCVLWVFLYKLLPPPVTATMVGNASAHGIAKDWTPLDRIDPDMARAVIAAEDAKFCEHGGFDRAAITDAWSRYREGGRIRGGSTISQQTAKNAFLWQGGGFFRKGLEAWFTLLIEQVWGKRRIMEVYLNVAETGLGTYGVEAGARRYFGHGSDRMTALEAARMAAVLPLPKRRGAVAPTGFTRRYGSSILARLGVVRREGLDACLDLAASTDRDEPRRQTTPRRRKPRAETEKELEAAVPAPDPVRSAPEIEVLPFEEPAPEPDPEPAPAVEEPAPVDAAPEI